MAQCKVSKTHRNNFQKTDMMAKDMKIIIQYLSEQCHVNVHTKNIIHIHSSSINHKNFNAENIVK